MRNWRNCSEQDLAAIVDRQRQAGRVRTVLAPSEPRSPIKPNKFGAKPTMVGDELCDSKKEAAQFLLLRERERRGEIKNLLLHGRVKLEVGGITICDFEPDFLYEENGKLTAKDAKGLKRGSTYDLFRVKARLFEAIHGTKVVEI